MTRLWLALCAVVALLSGVTASGADYTASSSSPANSFAAAGDFNTVAVALTDPGSPLHGTVSLAATGTSDRGIDRVRFQSSPAGAGTWSDVCEATAAPYTCDFDTTGVADGSRDLRAVAVDQAGYQRTDVVDARLIDNTAPTVGLPDPGVLRGTVSPALDASDGAGSGVASVAVELRTGGGPWQTVCSDSSAPFGCEPFDTTQLADGLYEARATAVDGAGLSTTSTPITVRVDNAVPTATLADPGTPLQGSVALNGTASDAGSGVVSWTVQRRPAGGGAWTDACADTTAPFAACTWDTTGVADALYDLRAVARDAAGNELATTPIADRRVDNNGPTVTLADPGSPLNGTVLLTATATDPAGVQSVVFERRLTGSSNWTTICTDTTASYSCSFDTTSLNGTYDLRARATDTLGRSSTSMVAARVIDNVALTGTDVQAGNASAGTAGRLEAGDWIQLTWSKPIAPASVLSGWDGTAHAITVRVKSTGVKDRMNFYDEANTTRLNLVDGANDLQLDKDFVSNDKTFSATMVQSGNSITITFGAVSATNLNTVTAAGALSWQPSGNVTDLAGNAGSTTTVNESGGSDVDF
jgi:Big-like domain-containing protein